MLTSTLSNITTPIIQYLEKSKLYKSETWQTKMPNKGKTKLVKHRRWISIKNPSLVIADEFKDQSYNSQDELSRKVEFLTKTDEYGKQQTNLVFISYDSRGNMWKFTSNENIMATIASEWQNKQLIMT